MRTDESGLADRASREPALLEHLAGHRMFGVLPKPALSDLAREARERAYQEGHYLYYAGDRPSYVFLVQAGLVALRDVDERGNHRLLLTYARNDVFGAVSTVLGSRYAATAIALTETKVLLIPDCTFVRLYRGYPELAMEVLRELAEELHRAQRAYIRVTHTPVIARVAKFLLEFAADAALADSAEASVDITLSRQALAMLVGTTPETISRVLARLTRARVLAVRDRHMVIRLPDELRRLGLS